MNKYLNNILTQYIPEVMDITDRELLVNDLLIFLNKEEVISYNYHEKRKFLHGTLNTLSPKTLKHKEIMKLNTLLQLELQDKDILDVNKLNKSTDNTDVVVWQGDITTLKIDVIVNAANSGLLGCFAPLHSCIDNAIHTAAGVSLRDDCFTLMEEQGHLEATGQAKITRAYNLPSKYVLHTVGPIVEDEVTQKHIKGLENSYINCLELCKEFKEIKSIAFCCISTGVFGYPGDKAAKVAYETVNRWIQDNPGVLDIVVFNVFTDKDKEIYNAF